MKQLCKKIQNQRGESLIETLSALLIVSVCFLMLAGGIVTAARVNRTAEQQAMITYDTTSKQPVEEFSVSVTYGNETRTAENLTGYYTGSEEKEGYYYYEKN